MPPSVLVRKSSSPITKNSGYFMKEAFTEPIVPAYRTENEELFLGDTFELLSEMRPESVDMVFADPPYFLSNDGVSCHSGRMVSVNKGEWDKGSSFEAKHESIQAVPITRPTCGSISITNADSTMLCTISSIPLKKGTDCVRKIKQSQQNHCKRIAHVSTVLRLRESCISSLCAT